MGLRGTAARPTAAADTAGRVFKSFPGPVFLQGSQSLGQLDGHLMPAWWAEGPGPATTSSCGHGNANCGPKTQGKRERVRWEGVGREREGERDSETGDRARAEVARGWQRQMPHHDPLSCASQSHLCLPLSVKPPRHLFSNHGAQNRACGPLGHTPDSP